MGLASALFSSVSGLDTTSTAITVAGDNIANVNTPGFKERRAEFSDVLGQSIAGVGGFSQLGSGSKLSRVATIFSQGTFENTGKGTDLAIEGPGFFLVDSDQGRFFTRAGLFNVDRQGELVNPEGLNVQGYGIDPATGLSNGQLGDIQIGTALAPPSPTSVIELSVNLDSTGPVTAPFDASNPNLTSNFRTVVTVYDTQGNPHTSTAFFTKTGTNTWDVNVALPTADTTVPPTDPGDNFVVQDTLSLTFDNDGVLTSPVGTPTTITYEFSGLSSPPPQSVDLSFGTLAAGASQVAATTQFASSNTTNAFVQDGFSAGTLQGIEIDRQGYVTGRFSNGETIPLSQLALATFPNVEGLQAVGNNRLIEARASGQALIGEPETGTFGSIRSGNIEQSNVDLAAQFVRLIINQRAFQANTRTISVTNELLANLNALGQ